MWQHQKTTRVPQASCWGGDFNSINSAEFIPLKKPHVCKLVLKFNEWLIVFADGLVAHPRVSLSTSPNLETHVAYLQTIQSVEFVYGCMAQSAHSGENYFYTILLKPNNLLEILKLKKDAAEYNRSKVSIIINYYCYYDIDMNT